MNNKYLLLLLCFVSSFVFSDTKPEYVDMNGTLKIWGRSEGEIKLPGFSVFLKGEAAKKLYAQMDAPALRNECFGDGTVSKYIGNFECSLDPKGAYSCSVGVGLKDQKIFRGESC